MINIVAISRSILGARATEDESLNIAHDLMAHLEIAVGHRLASRMTRHELDEFDQLSERGDGVGQHAFLERVAPDHRQVARDEFDALVEMFRRIVAARDGSPHFIAAVRGDLRDLLADFRHYLEASR